MASSLFLDLNTMFSPSPVEIYSMQSSFCGVFVETDELWVYDQVYLCIMFESSLNSFMYDWLSLQVSSNYPLGLAN